LRKWNDANLCLHEKDRNKSALVDIKCYQPSKEAVIESLQPTCCACGGSFVSFAHVGIGKQPRGAITELGGFRRKNHALGVVSCPPRADSVDKWNLCRNSRVALRCWSEQSEKHEYMKQVSNIKNSSNCFALVWDGSGFAGRSITIGVNTSPPIKAWIGERPGTQARVADCAF
jgi:hypothetical protein